MGGVQKSLTKVVDPFGIGKTKIAKQARGIIDPMNIMDPAGVLPGPKGGKFGTYSGAFGKIKGLSPEKKPKKDNSSASNKNPFKQKDKEDKKNKKDPMLAFLADMQNQQNAQSAAAAEAQRQALMQSQIVSGQQSQLQGEQSAKQDLATANSMQAIRDANALLASQQAQATAGQQATGGGFDVNEAQQEALANMGAAQSMLPTTPANVMAPATPVNPVFSGFAGQNAKKSNIFSLPKSSDLKFGGV
jgi:hypothetical protein